MVRNPTKRANARHLCEHLDLIEKHKAASGIGETQESSEPKKKKHRWDDDHKTIDKDQKSTAKGSYNVGTSLRSGSVSRSPAIDSVIRVHDSLPVPAQTPTPTEEEEQNPAVTADPVVTPKKSCDEASSKGITTPHSSTCTSDRQAASVAKGTRRAKKMMNSPVSPLAM
jgi:hypothetical protein